MERTPRGGLSQAKFKQDRYGCCNTKDLALYRVNYNCCRHHTAELDSVADDETKPNEVKERDTTYKLQRHVSRSHPVSTNVLRQGSPVESQTARWIFCCLKWLALQR